MNLQSLLYRDCGVFLLAIPELSLVTRLHLYAWPLHGVRYLLYCCSKLPPSIQLLNSPPGEPQQRRDLYSLLVRWWPKYWHRYFHVVSFYILFLPLFLRFPLRSSTTAVFYGHTIPCHLSYTHLTIHTLAHGHITIATTTCGRSDSILHSDCGWMDGGPQGKLLYPLQCITIKYIDSLL